MVDIHEHILPGLDDGAQSLNESIAMAELAVSQGIRHIVCSSHGNRFPYSQQEYRDAFAFLKEALEHYSIPLKIYMGQELLLDEQGIRLLKKRQVYSIHGSRYMLCEFHFDESSDRMLYLASQVRELGWTPVIAHPERYDSIIHDVSVAHELRINGCILQSNGASCIGFYGRACKNTVFSLLRSGIVSVLATDAHNPISRTSDTRFISVLNQEFSSQHIHLWTSENPSRIIKDMPLLQERRTN